MRTESVGKTDICKKGKKKKKKDVRKRGSMHCHNRLYEKTNLKYMYALSMVMVLDYRLRGSRDMNNINHVGR